MTSRPSTPSCASGLTLVELLVALSIVLVVTAGALSLSMSSRDLYQADNARTHLNQSLRAATELLGTDLRQAGERLPDDFPAIVIENGASGAPDRLALRRNLIDAVLPLCGSVGVEDEAIVIADETDPPPGCVPLEDTDADGWPDNLQAWRAARLEAAGSLRAYIFDPVTGNGEFFDYVGEDADALTIVRDDSDDLSFEYPIDNQCRVYVLEERRYALSNGLLQIVMNDLNASPLHLVDRIDGFQAAAVFEDGTIQGSLGAADVWSELRSIDIALDGSIVTDKGTISRSVSLELFPRNVLSR